MSNPFSLTRPRAVVLMTTLLTIMAAVAQAEQSHTLLANGPSENRIDIVLLGDGYTAAQLGAFADDVKAVVGRIFAENPFQTYRPYFNVRYVDVVSRQSGADHPERDAFVDTALRSFYNCADIQRLICVDEGIVHDVLLRSVGPDQQDVVIVLVNDQEYGGSGGSIAVSSVHSESAELVLHEVGHSFGLLADEYAEDGLNCENEYEPIEPNVTIVTSRSKIKWAKWIDAGTPVPTWTFEPDQPGLYEQGKYCQTGMYRPTYESKMRTLGYPFQQINTEQLVKRMYNLVTPIDEALPYAARVAVVQGERVQFSVRTVRPADHGLRILWTLDGQRAPGAAALAVDTLSLSTGEHQITATVADTTAFVRNDPAHVLSETHTWTLEVVGRTPPLVRVLSPNGGEALRFGVPATITWEASDADGLQRFGAAVSVGGSPFAAVPGCAALPGSRRSCTWSAPGPVATDLRIRVTAVDVLGVSASDVSDNLFSVLPAELPTASAIKALLRELREFNPPTGLRHSLENQLTAALSAFERANAAATCGKLRAFTHHMASAAGRRLARSQRLHAGASALMVTVGCSVKSEQ
jgi:hypothetical protein